MISQICLTALTVLVSSILFGALSKKDENPNLWLNYDVWTSLTILLSTVGFFVSLIAWIWS